MRFVMSVRQNHAEEPEQSQAEVADLYSRVAPAYAEAGPPYFALAGRRLVDLAGVKPGDSVLDLGTGRGAVLLPAAERVGLNGHVLGIDIAPGMIEHTRRAIADRGLTQAEARLLDASHLDLEPAQFTHTLSSFSVFFFPDLRQVLRELRHVLRPNGIAGFAFSRGTDPRWSWYEELLRRAGALEGLPRQSGYPAIRERDVLTGLLKEAGFAAPTETVEPTDFWYVSPEQWWASLWTHGSRRPLERMSQDLLNTVKAEALAHVQHMAESRGIPERMHLVYVLARS